MSRILQTNQIGMTSSNVGPIRWYDTCFFLKHSNNINLLNIKIRMAPEALFNKLYSNKSDVYSFGMTLIETL